MKRANETHHHTHSEIPVHTLKSPLKSKIFQEIAPFVNALGMEHPELCTEDFLNKFWDVLHGTMNSEEEVTKPHPWEDLMQ